MKEWLCLTCQMHRALAEAESVEPPLRKPQTLPNKVSTPASAPKDIIANKTDVTSTQQAEVPDKKQKDTPTSGAPQDIQENKTPSQADITKISTTVSPAVKETQGTVSATAKEETGSPPITEVLASTVPSMTTTDVASDVNKQHLAQAPTVISGSETSVEKRKDLTPPSSQAAKGASQKKEEKAEIVQKSSDQLVKSTEVKPQQIQDKEFNLAERSVSPAAQPAAPQESGRFFSFGSPKSQRAASQTTEAVTGKMLGFGSSLFSSASTLITSAVKEESRTTPPNSRKMSAPAQVSRKMSVSPKSTPPVSPRMAPAKETKSPSAQTVHLEKTPEKPEQTKVPPSDQTKMDKGPPGAPQTSTQLGQTCPLCKAELNMGSKDPPNYNTCTECKANVCNKCGFSPMPNITEVSKQQKTFL